MRIHQWTDFKASNESSKNPGSMWTYYRCTACGSITDAKHSGECSGFMRFKPMTDKEILEAIHGVPFQ